MLSPRWRKVLADLWANKTRTVLVALSIAVGVAAVGMVASSQAILSMNLRLEYQATNPASTTLFVEPFDQDLVDSVKRVPGVLDAQATRPVNVRVKTGPDEWRNMRLYAINDFNDIRINKIWPQQGASVPPVRQMVIERTSVAFIGAKEGEDALIETTDGKPRTMRIAGTVHDVGKQSAFWAGSAFGYITLDTLEWLSGDRTFSDLHIIVDGDARDKEHVKSIADRVEKKVEDTGRKVMGRDTTDPGKHWADDAMQAMLLIMGVIAALSLVLSGFLTINTISAVLAQQIRQIGIMKAIGARGSQIMAIYLAVVLGFSLFGLLLGIPMGVAGASGLASYSGGLLNFEINRFEIPTEVLAIQIGVGLLVPLLASLFPILSGTRTTAREAMSNYGLPKGHFGVSFLDRILGQIRGLSRPLLLSLRNTFRRRGRLALTLTTLTLGGAIFIAVFTVQSSLLLTLDDALQYWQYDVRVQFRSPQRVEQAEAAAQGVPGVTKAEAWAYQSIHRVRPDKTESKSMLVVAPPADTKMLKPTLLEGRWLIPEDENAIVINTEVPRDESDVKVGDDIILKINDRESSWHVVGLVKGVLAGPILYANAPYFMRAMHTAGRGSSVQVMTVLHDRDYHLEIARALERHFENIGMSVRATELISNIRESAVSQFNIIIAFLMVMAVLLAIVGGLGLMGTMSINVLERTREIGVMRAIGASDGSVLSVFMVEGVLIGVVSWVMAGLMAVPLSKALSDAVGVAFMRQPLSYSFSQKGLLMWLAIVVAVAALASFWPARSASRLTVREVLAYE